MNVTLSTLATFDDLRRCVQVLVDGAAEKEFLKILQLQEKLQLECLSRAKEAQRIQRELDASLQSMADLETKLFHARRLLEKETKARREAEYERDQLEKKIMAVSDLLQYENNLKNETKDKLALLRALPRKRKSINSNLEEKYGNDINSTGSFLSGLSITQSEDDFLDLNHGTRTCYKYQPTATDSPPITNYKRSRLNRASMGSNSAARRSLRCSGIDIQKENPNQKKLDFEHICATTTVTIPKGGNCAIRAESTIETVPVLHLEEEPDEVQCTQHEPPSTPKTIFKQTVDTPRTPVNKQTDSPILNHHLTPLGTLKRAHNFGTKTFLKSETCIQCQKKIRFGSIGLRCRDCPVRCHSDCSAGLTVMCMPTTGTPVFKGVLGYLTDYATTRAPLIPPLIVHCVNEIESRGLNEEGLYRVSGSERDIKALKERFLRRKSVPHLANIDVHVLCGCIKDFLRSLREPLIPTRQWKDFCNAVQNPFEEDIRKDLYKAIDELPQANRDTLAFLILHFQRIAECHEVKMSMNNIATVFCPTIVGYSSPDPDKHAICTEVYTQYNVMLNLLKIPFDYWAQFVMLEEEKENSENVATLKPTPSRNNNNKESILYFYATPSKSFFKKRNIYDTPPPL